MSVTLTPFNEAIRAGQLASLGVLGTENGSGTVTFRGDRLNVVINERPTESWRDGSKANGKAKVDLLAKDMVTIQVLYDQLQTEPLSGEIFTQGGVTNYRIQEVQPYTTHWICLCKGSAIA
jgi:hypothetical protein